MPGATKRSQRWSGHPIWVRTDPTITVRGPLNGPGTGDSGAVINSRTSTGRGPCIIGNSFSEFPCPPIAQSGPNTNITVQFEGDDLSRGTARFTGARHLGKNLAVKPNAIPGHAGDLMVHGNVKVELEVNGKKVPMTQRFVRYWPLLPEPGTTVANGGRWILGAPDTRFWLDAPSTKDAPGWQVVFAEDKPVGQLQEFLAGNPEAGGVYYQTWTLTDPDGTSRVVHFNLVRLSPQEYHDAVRRINRRDALGNSFLLDVPFAPEPLADSGILHLPLKKAPVPKSPDPKPPAEKKAPAEKKLRMPPLR